MRTWRQDQLGEPLDVLRLDQVDPPTPGDGEVVLDVEAVGLTFPDVLMGRGEYQAETKLPYSPGSEVVGRIRGTDRRVVTFGGAAAEQVAVDERRCIDLPEGITAGVAAALLVNYATAYYALHERGRLQAGDWVLVTAGAGGVGSAAVDLATAAGARVVAVAGGPDKVETCRGLGAEVAIDYLATPDFVDAVREATGGGVDVCFDPVGGEVFGHARRCMAWGGRLLVIGFASGTIPDLPANHVLLKSYEVVGVFWGASIVRDPASLGRQQAALHQLLGEGRIDPAIHPPYAFEALPRALDDIANRRTRGKVVVDVG